MIAVLLASISLYGSNVGSIYAQNNALGQSGNSEAEQTIEPSRINNSCRRNRLKVNSRMSKATIGGWSK